MPIKAALFDIGNVLLTFDHDRAFRTVLPKATTTPDALRNAVLGRIPAMETGNLTSEQFLEEICEEIRFTGTTEEFRAAYCDIFELNQPQWQLVRELQNRLDLCLFSNTSQLHEDYIFQRYPEFHLFPKAVMSWRVGHMKPSREIYALAQAELGVEPQEIIYIDDLPANVAMGKAYGFQTHAYNPNDHAALLTWLDAIGVEHG